MARPVARTAFSRPRPDGTGFTGPPSNPLADISGILRRSKESDGTYYIRPRDWPTIAAYFRQPVNTDLITPFSGPFANIGFSRLKPASGGAGAANVLIGAPLDAVTGGAFSSAADAINSALDFMKIVTWLFHPINWLRAVEFLTGIGLILYGLKSSNFGRGGRGRGGSIGKLFSERQKTARARERTIQAGERTRHEEQRTVRSKEQTKRTRERTKHEFERTRRKENRGRKS